MRRLITTLGLVWLAMPVSAGVTITDDDRPPSARRGSVIRPALMRESAPAAEPDDIPAQPAPTWNIDADTDGTYQAAFGRWAKRADWELVWMLPERYEIAHRSPGFAGEFVDVMGRALSGLGAFLCLQPRSAVCGVDVTFWEGNRVVTVAPLPRSAVKPDDDSTATKRKRK